MHRVYLVLSLLLLLLFPTDVQATTISNVKIEVSIDSAGNAKINETWEVDVDSGTEWYLSLENIEGRRVHGLTVVEGDTTFLDEGSWNVERGINEKAYRSGIAKTGDDSYELCWGIGNFGGHVFEVEYFVDGLVRKYKDGRAGFNHMFLSRGLSHAVSSASITINYPEGNSDSDTLVWAFGFSGNVVVEKSKAEITSNSPIQTSNAMIVLLETNPSLYSNLTVLASRNFSDVHDKAMKGSDYGGGKKPSSILGVIISMIAAIFLFTGGVTPILIIVLVFYMIIKHSPKTREYYKNEYGIDTRDFIKSSHYTSEVPSDLGLVKMAGLVDILPVIPLNCRQKIVGAFIMKWLLEGVISLEESQTKGRKRFVLTFNDTLHTEDSCEAQLYIIIRNSLPADSSTIHEDQLKRYLTDRGELVRAWMGSCKVSSYIYMKSEDLIQIHYAKNNKFIPVYSTTFTENGLKKLSSTLGFYNYLKNFTLIEDKDVKQVALWDEYLVIATLFGIAEKVHKELKSLHPDYFAERAHYTDMVKCSSSIGKTAGNASSSSSGSGGSGGSSSSGGGGGSSGGGGGGSR